MAPPPPPPKQLVLAASSADAGVAAWDLRTGAEEIRHRPCASRPRALTSVADRFLAAAQAPPAGGNSGTVHFYHWDKVSPSRKAPNGALELRSLTPGLFSGFDCSHRWPSRASPLSLYARFLRTRRGATSLAVAATATYSFGR